MRVPILICVKLVLLFTNLLHAQSPSEDYLGSWYTLGSSHRLLDHLSITSYSELRFYEPSSNYNLLFISLRGNYHLKENQTIGLGYAYLDIDRVFEFDKQPNIHEHRLFEQYTLKHKISKLSILHRGRLEHRFLDLRGKSDVQNRFRYLICFTYPLNNCVSLVISEEPFINFQNQVFHENRFFSGLKIKLLKHTNFQVGYLRQNISKKVLNRIRTGISIKLDHRKQL